MMKTIDCLLIGHNEMNFAEYERSVRSMGFKSGAYRDLNLNFIQYNNKPYGVAEIFNLFYRSGEYSRGTIKPFNMLETFSPAIAYLGSYLKKRGFTFDYIHSFQEEKEELSKKLVQDNILTIAIITTLYVSVLPILEIVKFVRTYNHSTKIIVGGPFISTKIRSQGDTESAYLFKAINADFYVNSSQGEATLVRIIGALKNNLNPGTINNIYYKTGDQHVSTPVLKEDNKLAENRVDWSLFSDRLGEYAAVRTALSCPFSCAFCGFPEHAGNYQTVDVDKIERELNQLAQMKRLKSLHFIDDTFNVPVKRFKEILRMMIKNRFEFKWHSYFRCQFADEEMVELMKESGCEGVFLGLESGNDQILKNMNKNSDREKYFRGIELLKKHGIVTFGNFIIGFPGETHETAADTASFIKKSGLDFYRVQLWYCEPITPIWKERAKYNLEGESFEWSHATMDAKTASDIIDETFVSAKESTWIPQYNFDFDGLWHLIHRGITLEEAKTFLESFNNGMKEKLTRPDKKEISLDSLKRLISVCQPGNKEHDIFAVPPSKTAAINADFDF